MVKKAAEDRPMAKLYREVVLKEKPAEGGFVPLTAFRGGIQPKKPVVTEEMTTTPARSSQCRQQPAALPNQQPADHGTSSGWFVSIPAFAQDLPGNNIAA